MNMHTSVHTVFRLALALWLALVALLALQWSLHLLPTWAVLSLLVLLSMPVWWFRYEYDRRRRQAVLNALLRDDAALYRLLRGRPWLLLKNGVMALATMAVVLAALAAGLPLYYWLVFFLWVPIWVALYPSIGQAVGAQVRPLHAPFVLARTQGLLSAAVLVVLLLVIGFFEPMADLRGLALEEVLAQPGLAPEALNSLLLTHLAEAWALLDTLRVWMVHNMTSEAANRGVVLLAWLVALVQKSLIVFPLVLLLQAVQVLLSSEAVAADRRETRAATTEGDSHDNP